MSATDRWVSDYLQRVDPTLRANTSPTIRVSPERTAHPVTAISADQLTSVQRDILHCRRLPDLYSGMDTSAEPTKDTADSPAQPSKAQPLREADIKFDKLNDLVLTMLHSYRVTQHSDSRRTPVQVAQQYQRALTVVTQYITDKHLQNGEESTSLLSAPSTVRRSIATHITNFLGQEQHSAGVKKLRKHLWKSVSDQYKELVETFEAKSEAYQQTHNGLGLTDSSITLEQLKKELFSLPDELLFHRKPVKDENNDYNKNNILRFCNSFALRAYDHGDHFVFSCSSQKLCDALLEGLTEEANYMTGKPTVLPDEEDTSVPYMNSVLLPKLSEMVQLRMLISYLLRAEVIFRYAREISDLGNHDGNPLLQAAELYCVTKLLHSLKASVGTILSQSLHARRFKEKVKFTVHQGPKDPVYRGDAVQVLYSSFTSLLNDEYDKMSVEHLRETQTSVAENKGTQPYFHFVEVKAMKEIGGRCFVCSRPSLDIPWPLQYREEALCFTLSPVTAHYQQQRKLPSFKEAKQFLKQDESFLRSKESYQRLRGTMEKYTHREIVAYADKTIKQVERTPRLRPNEVTRLLSKCTKFVLKVK
ncbi:hypothetical protein ADEAN_000137000 [Angomonas deanei]|uniref:Uncharacterized protein n=1 Tax=Angomonas deanei TaxID=59799 RepID=A0A7G2C2P1_9TRYP|nr:hypothetical protein ADEAN_000137000 [Angomonas deanei]